MELATFKALAEGFSVLYVEDDEAIRNSVTTYLQKFFARVESAEDGQAGLDRYREDHYDIVITDIQMPRMDGIEMLSQIKQINPEQETIVISAYSEPAYFTDAILLGVSGYVIKPINFIQINETLYRSLTRLVLIRENREYKEHLEEIVAKRTKEKLRLEAEKYENFEKTLQSLVHMIEGRDTYTGGHSQRVAGYCRMIASHMGFSKAECDLIYRAGILHDIGKIATPDTILLKPGKLSDLEYRLIKEHVTVGRDLLINIPMYHDMANIIRHHHERYDGKGYPDGLEGDGIPLLAHVMIVADAFDAMTTNRIYKARMSVAEALDEVRRLSGVQFHPDVAAAVTESEVLADVKPLESISQLPLTETEQERFAYYYRDRVTRAYNQEYLSFILAANSFSGEYRCLNVLYLNHFGRYNKANGWHQGDALLVQFADYLFETYREIMLFRIYGDDFIMLSRETLEVDPEQFRALPWFSETTINVLNRSFDLSEVTIDSLEALEALL